MADAAQSRQYFLGIGGQQSGPFSESEILQQWKSTQIPDDALVWYEGLEDWKPAAEILGALAPASAAAAPPPGLGPRSRNAESSFSTFASKEDGLNPVFDDDSAGNGQSSFLSYRLHFFFGTLVLLGFLGVGGFYFYTSFSGPKTSTPTAPTPGKKVDRREIEYRSAVADILLNPEKATAAFERLVKENPNDSYGKQALESAIDFYRRGHRYHEIGRLLLVANRPADAISYFRGEQPSPNEELNALQLAFVQSKKPEYLNQQIELLLGALNSIPRALEKIRQFESEFPKLSHSYGYYLKSQDEQIADLFSRISFFFVQSLLSFIETELPQIHLDKRPLVELRRDRSGGYRIEGTYRGNVTLSRDPLKNIHLVFWIEDDQWVLVETNLTKERAIWSAKEKARLQKNVMTSSELIASLEQRFRTQFPKASLHQSVKPTDAAQNQPASE